METYSGKAYHNIAAAEWKGHCDELDDSAMTYSKSDQRHKSTYFRVPNDEHDVDGFAKPIDNKVARTPLPVAETRNICIGKRLVMENEKGISEYLRLWSQRSEDWIVDK